MADSSAHLKVGAAFLAAAAILFAGILWLKEYKPAAATVQVRVLFDDANGISSGDPVTVSGIKAGEVEKVVLTPENRALVSLAVNRSVLLHPDASFAIRDMGLMGDKAVVMNPGLLPARSIRRNRWREHPHPASTGSSLPQTNFLRTFRESPGVSMAISMSPGFRIRSNGRFPTCGR